MENKLSEVSAEMWLNYLYPELMEEWTVVHAGTFWRNYSNDAMSIKSEKAKVRVSRNGVMKLLPQGFISSENDMRGRDPLAVHQVLKRRKAILSDAFLPFDSIGFIRRLKLEHNVSEILNSKKEFILRHFFGIDPDTVTDPYVSEAVYLLPFMKDLRGNYSFVRNLLSLLLDCRVSFHIGKYSDTDTTLRSLPRVLFYAEIPGLDKDAYIAKCKEIKPLEDFIKEWMIPAEAVCEIKVCSDGCSSVQESTLLDYNARAN